MMVVRQRSPLICLAWANQCV